MPTFCFINKQNSHCALFCPAIKGSLASWSGTQALSWDPGATCWLLTLTTSRDAYVMHTVSYAASVTQPVPVRPQR